MAVEIERKFLVHHKIWKAFPKGEGAAYRQGYLNRGGKATVRVRLTPDTGYLTIKGKTVGISRPEYEYSIPKEDALALLELCGSELSKVRYHIPWEGRVWEVDEFEGANAGLIVAEIELPDEHATFSKPEWIAEEVTSDRRYGNNFLSQVPYSTWKRTKGISTKLIVQLVFVLLMSALFFAITLLPPEDGRSTSMGWRIIGALCFGFLSVFGPQWLNKKSKQR